MLYLLSLSGIPGLQADSKSRGDVQWSGSCIGYSDYRTEYTNGRELSALSLWSCRTISEYSGWLFLSQQECMAGLGNPLYVCRPWCEKYESSGTYDKIIGPCRCIIFDSQREYDLWYGLWLRYGIEFFPSVVVGGILYQYGLPCIVWHDHGRRRDYFYSGSTRSCGR